ncbi:germin-like protein 9-3 [Citrus sinensis]|uniref:germin-like protein 9-3 n=1 Tax=Citrus clementina TaxID=85681 RepID=UPI000CED3BD1|nr:germin-like protein 9-3 [Citrus x clementina]XP_052294398.1 germin-like protein 9-3 [Citrus sinensis]
MTQFVLLLNAIRGDAASVPDPGAVMEALNTVNNSDEIDGGSVTFRRDSIVIWRPSGGVRRWSGDLLARSNGGPAVIRQGDPDILDDFLVPPGIDINSVTRQYFTFTGLRDMQRVNYTGKTESIVRRVTKKIFPALEGLGVSVSRTFYPPLSITPPHYHPRSSELLVALDGPLEISFIDTRNKLFVQTLQAGDLFVIPRGLIHFVNYTRGDCGGGTMGIFGSANPGTVTLGSTLFESGIKADLLAKSLQNR